MDIQNDTKYAISQMGYPKPSDYQFISALTHEFKGRKEVLGYSNLDDALKWDTLEEAEDKLAGLTSWAKGKHKVIAIVPCGTGWHITHYDERMELI